MNDYYHDDLIKDLMMMYITTNNISSSPMITGKLYSYRQHADQVLQLPESFFWGGRRSDSIAGALDQYTATAYNKVTTAAAPL